MPTTTRSRTGHSVQSAPMVPMLRIIPEASLGAIVVGGFAPVLLWFNDTEFVNGMSGWLTNAGRLTGLECGYLIALLLVLMARVPALDRGVGTDRLARWHAIIGRYTVSLALAHTLLIIWGYAVAAHASVITQTKTLVLSYPDVLMATVGLGLFVMVGISSARIARRKLRYETWHALHLYTYMAIGLSFAHAFATGADFSTNLPARVLWSAMYVIAIGLVLWFRFARPVLNMARHQMRVESVQRESADTVSIWITGHNLNRLRAESGQFFRWRFLTAGLWWAANPYSLSAAPQDNRLRLTVKDLGEHSGTLAMLKPGTRVLAEGPYGAFTSGTRRHSRVLLIAGGVGITPIRALFESIYAHRGALTLIYRAGSVRDVYFADELERIATRRGATVHYLFGHRGDAHRPDPLNADALHAMAGPITEQDIYLCGPSGMVEQTKSVLRRAGVRRRDIHHESFVF